MHPTLRVCSAAASGRAHKPLIHFLGKRQWPSTPEAPHPHPAAPPEFKERFSDFLNKFQASAETPQSQTSAPGSSKGGKDVRVYNQFWEAPERLWKRELQDWEIELVMTGGASAHC
ncbi:hypothetical protein OBBRIDRAFT_838488 [Obba rivulosa]|uniref:Uncharacterized protein n=1 Tax=Obba rivulosa TaxID=1052685 RepID=A0A8E2DGJ8_9APHY|nr:hypothetical protein OBBRIDRAFT_838488 [Obba rivulosa]